MKGYSRENPTEAGIKDERLGGFVPFFDLRPFCVALDMSGFGNLICLTSDLCRAQKLFRHWFYSPGSACRWIKPFGDQPERKNQFLQAYWQV
jgi:hypothetical protein